MTIEKFLDDLESLVIDSPRVPFTNKLIIEEDHIARIIDDLRETLPTELRDANHVLTEREKIIADAQQEGQKIVDHANQYSAKLTDNNVITQKAQEQAQKIIAHAQSDAQQLQKDAIAYADRIFAQLENNLGDALQVIKAGHKELDSQGNEEPQANPKNNEA